MEVKPLIHAIGWVSGLMALGKLFAFLRDVLMAAYFGTSAGTDVYLVTRWIPITAPLLSSWQSERGGDPDSDRAVPTAGSGGSLEVLESFSECVAGWFWTRGGDWIVHASLAGGVPCSRLR